MHKGLCRFCKSGLKGDGNVGSRAGIQTWLSRMFPLALERLESRDSSKLLSRTLLELIC